MNFAQFLALFTGICFLVNLVINLAIGIIALIGWIPLWQGALILEQVFPLLGQAAKMVAGSILTSILLVFIGCFFAFVFGVKCVEWRKEPSSHRLGLVLTGVLGLFLGYSYFSFHLFFGYFGLLTGFLAIITSGFSLLFEDDNA